MSRTVIRVASYKWHVGRTAVSEGWTLLYVPSEEQADIRIQRYTKDFKYYSERPYRVGTKAFASMKNAVREVVKQGVLND